MSSDLVDISETAESAANSRQNEPMHSAESSTEGSTRILYSRASSRTMSQKCDSEVKKTASIHQVKSPVNFVYESSVEMCL